MVRYDGLYQTGTAEEGAVHSRHYLLFRPSGAVHGVTSTGEARDVEKWLGSFEYESRGKFEVEENHIHFSLTSEYGTVLYDGIIDTEYRLILTVESLINGYVTEDVYYLIKN